MLDNRDIRYAEKRIDDSWKEEVDREKARQVPVSSPKESAAPQQTSERQQKQTTSRPFLSLVNSLALQTLMHLGEVPNPETQEAELNLDAAREVIDLLSAVYEKTKGNLSSEEALFFEKLLPELQMKYVQRS